jgi:short-subunit dehydrogenase
VGPLRPARRLTVTRELSGCLAPLTGASSGLGPVIARRLRREDVRFVLSARDRARLALLAEELGEAVVVPADLARRGEAERLADAAGDVDILICGAGLPANGAPVDFEVHHLDHALDVNVRSAMLLTRQLLPGMLERRRGRERRYGSPSTDWS